MNSNISIVKCKEYDPQLVFAQVRKSIELLGGISQFVKPGCKVLVKPNMLMSAEPEKAIDTHPLVVQGVIKLLKEIGCKVYLGDGPSAWGSQQGNIDGVYEKTGMKAVALEENVELIKFDKSRWRGKFPLTTWLDQCEYFISVPKFKTHGLTTLTGGIKNLFGLVSANFKVELHRRHFDVAQFSSALTDIYEAAKPSLTVIDGIVALEGDGPATAGRPRQCGLILAGSDCVAIDSVLALIMGIDPLDVPTTKEAAKRGLGNADINSVNVLGESLEDVVGEPFILPKASTTSRLPKPVIHLAKKLLRFYPEITQSKCEKCGACVYSCPQKMITIEKNRVRIDRSGCISCFCCQEMCPNSAIKAKKGILARIMGL